MSKKDDDAADFRLLQLANGKRKFAISMPFTGDAAFTAAFERGIDEEWFALVDMSYIAEGNGHLFRVFRLTDAGVKRLAYLRKAGNK